MKKSLKIRAKELKLWIPTLFLAIKKKETPIGAKVMAGLTVGYALSPIDLIPDFIPILGYLDDVIILPLMISLTLKLIPKEIISICKLEAADMWKNGKPKHWYYAIPIVVIWAIIIYVIVYNILKV